MQCSAQSKSESSKAKNKNDRVKMTSCINVYTYMLLCTFMCVCRCVNIYIFLKGTEYMHESQLVGLGYIYILGNRMRGKFARASICMKATLQVG